MIRQRFVKLLKYGTLGTVIGASGYLLQQNDWEMSTVGVVRFGRAAFTAAVIVVDYKWSLRNLDPKCEEYSQIKSQVHTRSAVKLRQMCCKNGGAFIKVGQHVGTLEYLLPAEYVSTMKVLHNDAPQSPVEDLYTVLEQDLGKKVDEIFDDFSPHPVGTASLAQVHKATTKDGKIVAVKIQHPKVKAHSAVDIRTMEFLIHRVAWIFPDFQYVWLAEETKKNLPLELDFLREGKHCERAAKVFKKFKFLKVPRVYWEYCSDRVLTMEFCEGGKVDDLAYMNKHGINIKEVSRNLGKLYSEMIFVNGYVHCDPHPGNVLVHQTDKGLQIVLLDHGLYQTLTDDFRVNYCKLWMSMIQADEARIEKYSKRLNVGHLYRLFACMLTARAWESISAGMDKKQMDSAETDLLRDNVSTYMVEISDVLNSIPRQLLLIMKTNDVIRGIEASIHTPANASSFIHMSKCCTRAVGDDKLRQCNGWFGGGVRGLRVRLFTQWQLLKIQLYELVLVFNDSAVGKYFMRDMKTMSS